MLTSVGSRDLQSLDGGHEHPMEAINAQTVSSGCKVQKRMVKLEKSDQNLYGMIELTPMEHLQPSSNLLLCLHRSKHAGFWHDQLYLH